jgi:tungstate transport system substrate-binding protein
MKDTDYNMKKSLLLAVTLLLGLLLTSTVLAAPMEQFESETLTLATGTTTYDSGLLDFILPDFEAQTGATVEVISVGTGQALELGRNGDADVVLVHDRAQEDAFVADGHAPARYDVMYNDFVIVGPASDPAGIADATSVTEALSAIADAEATFVSRGDDSGTHSKELSLWAAADLDPSGDWYQQAGQGMGAVLTIANEQEAYTIADRATYLAVQAEGNELVVLVEGDESLFNPYGVMPVDPSKNDAINGELAHAFVDWLISVETQELIAAFEVNGTPLFTPNSEPYITAQDAG